MHNADSTEPATANVTVSQKEIAPTAAVMCVPGITRSTFRCLFVRQLEAGGLLKVPSRREKRRGQVEPGQRCQTPAGDSQQRSQETRASALAVVA